MCLMVVANPVGLAAPAFGASGGGGTAAPLDPEVTGLRCLTTPSVPCPSPDAIVRGGRVRVLGRRLDASLKLVFRGERGARDDVTAPAAHVRSGHFESRVPERARSGPLEVLSAIGVTARAARPARVTTRTPIDLAGAGRTFFVGGERQPALTVTLAAPATVAVEAIREPGALVVARWDVASPAGVSVVRWDAYTPQGPAPSGTYRLRIAPEVGAAAAALGDPGVFAISDHIFPIRGRHDLGNSDTNNYGGARDHKGQDLFAACGTRLAAARAGTVKFAASDARAGNYVVIEGAGSNLDYVYMHMRAPALVRKGERVFTGQKLGEVGASGNADGCHLHFELWRAPGWITGGTAIDPLPLLRAWDAAS